MQKKAKKPTNADVLTIKKLFLERYRDAKSELEYKNAYELLVAIILSAQCTDKRVNIITPKLFDRFPTVAAMSEASTEEMQELIGSCSFFNAKSKNLIGMAQLVMQRFGGEIPFDESSLISLPGVGQKTAHVLLCEYMKQNYMAVDTHVFRVSHRLGLSNEKSAVKTEADLVKAFKTDLHTLHLGIVLFGRYICTARNPKCEECFLVDFCHTKENFKPI